MIWKKSMSGIPKIATGFFTALLLTGCNPHETKPNLSYVDPHIGGVELLSLRWNLNRI